MKSIVAATSPSPAGAKRFGVFAMIAVALIAFFQDGSILNAGSLLVLAWPVSMLALAWLDRKDDVAGLTGSTGASFKHA